MDQNQAKGAAGASAVLITRRRHSEKQPLPPLPRTRKFAARVLVGHRKRRVIVEERARGSKLDRSPRLFGRQRAPGILSRRKWCSRDSGDRHIPSRRWCSAAVARYSVALTMISSHASFLRPDLCAGAKGVGHSKGSHQLRFSKIKPERLALAFRATSVCAFADVESRNFHIPIEDKLMGKGSVRRGWVADSSRTVPGICPTA
jgi:hypothetical protein